MVTPSLAKEDWKIIRALSEEVGVTLPYDTIHQVRDRLADLAPFFSKSDYVEPSSFDDLSLAHRPGRQHLSRVPFADPIDNFYMTDAVSRNSKNMARCTDEINP